MQQSPHGFAVVMHSIHYLILSSLVQQGQCYIAMSAAPQDIETLHQPLVAGNGQHQVVQGDDADEHAHYSHRAPWLRAFVLVGFLQVTLRPASQVAPCKSTECCTSVCVLQVTLGCYMIISSRCWNNSCTLQEYSFFFIAASEHCMLHD